MDRLPLYKTGTLALSINYLCVCLCVRSDVRTRFNVLIKLVSFLLVTYPVGCKIYGKKGKNDVKKVGKMGNKSSIKFDTQSIVMVSSLTLAIISNKEEQF